MVSSDISRYPDIRANTSHSLQFGLFQRMTLQADKKPNNCHTITNRILRSHLNDHVDCLPATKASDWSIHNLQTRMFPVDRFRGGHFEQENHSGSHSMKCIDNKPCQWVRNLTCLKGTQPSLMLLITAVIPPRRRVKRPFFRSGHFEMKQQRKHRCYRWH